MKNIWKYIVLLGGVLLCVNLFVVMSMMPFYQWNEPLPHWVETFLKVCIILLTFGGALGFLTNIKLIFNVIKEILE